MVDTLTPAERSERMSRIRSRDTQPELVVRRYLHRAGLRYRVHARDLPGNPDIVMPKYGVIIFVEGCFWHGHYCQGGRVPATNSSFWAAKIAGNRARDKRNRSTLRHAGWHVLRIWECQLTKRRRREETLGKLVSRIRVSSPPDWGHYKALERLRARN